MGKMTMDELEELMTNIINEREGVRNGTKRAEFLDDMYLIVDGEINSRKALKTA